MKLLLEVVSTEDSAEPVHPVFGQVSTIARMGGRGLGRACNRGGGGRDGARVAYKSATIHSRL